MVHYYDDCFDRYHNEPLSCMGAKASQPTHFLKFRLTGFRLSEINCITCTCMHAFMYVVLAYVAVSIDY